MPGQNPKGKGGEGRRIPRVEKEIQGVVSEYISSFYKGEIKGLLAINRVIVASDLRSAKILVSLIGGEEADAEKAVKVLQGRAFEIQDYIHDRLPMKYCPKLTFMLDKTIDKVLKVESLLHEIEQNRKNKGS